MNRRTILIGVASAVVVSLLWYFLLWSPRNKDLSHARTRRTAAEATVTELEQKLSRLKGQQKNEALQRAQLETLRTAIPDDPNLAQFILDVNDAAVKSGIDFISISPTPPATAAPVSRPAAAPSEPASGSATTTTAVTPAAPAAPPPATINVALTISGGYFQILDFVNRLDELPRLLVIDGINVAAVAGADIKLNVSLTSRMFAHAAPVAGAAATTTTTAAPGSSGSTTTTTAGAR